MAATILGSGVIVQTGVSLATVPGSSPITIISDGTHADSYWTLSGAKIIPDNPTLKVGLGTVDTDTVTDNYFLLLDTATNEVKKTAATGVSGVGHTQDWSTITATPTTLSGYGIVDTLQPLDTDLTSIAALGYTSTSFLKKTAADTWALDTNTYSGSSHTHDALYSPLVHTHDVALSNLGFKTTFVRNKEMDVTLSLANSTKLAITNKNGQILTVDNMPYCPTFDTTGWVAMLCDVDKTNAADPSGDYLYKAFCTIDKVAKILTFAVGVNLASWEVTDNLVLYNPFINYEFVGDQSAGAIVSVDTAPAWRLFQTYNAPIFRHSDGRFIMLITGFAGGSGPTGLGYAYSYDMITWVMGNSDAAVWLSGAIAGCTMATHYGDAHSLGNGNYWCAMMSVEGTQNIPRIFYFNENLDTFTWSAGIIVDAGGGYSLGGIEKIGDYYHALVRYIDPLGTTYRSIQAFKSLTLEGPYTFYQTIAQGQASANDGVPWSWLCGVPYIGKLRGKVIGMFEGTAYYSLSGTKGNKEFTGIDFIEDTGLWALSKKGHTIINPMYWTDLTSTYAWARDHAGGGICIWDDGDAFYLTTTFKGDTTYEAGLLKLKLT